MSAFQSPIVPDDVGELIDLSVHGRDETAPMAELQRRGIAALYNILCDHPFAFLADEVGMGKTYQAMGLAALVWNENPRARVLFISPRQHLQTKWVEDYRRFFASNYRRPQQLGDDLVASTLFREPVHRPMYFDNLRSWTPTIGMRERIAPFFRHTSFTRPVYVTGQDLQDVRALWRTTTDKFRAWGLYEVERPGRLTRDNAPRELNLAFARALNARLSAEAGQAPYFDLAVIDEAQCLRHPDNQTNLVLHEALRGHVRKWLYMSATPAHGGPEDLPRILNHYPGQGEVLDPALSGDLPGLQRALQSFMVRRPRKYRTSKEGNLVDKTQYRSHDPSQWAVTEDAMSTLGTLAMGLVQKGLVGVLQGRSNRFRVGFLSSFESLQSSIANSNTLPVPGDDDGEELGDWHRDKTERTKETEAPDTEFVQRLNDAFEQKFGRPLPHPKVDAVVDQIAPLAFGDDEQPGGEEFLVFTRRVSTVETLRRRLMDRYHAALERRVARCWGSTLAWDGPGAQPDAESSGDGDSNDPEAEDAEDSEGPLRKAMAKGGWLFRYRQTFRTSGRNATVLEDGWLRRLCEAGGVDPARAAEQLPDELWAESLTHASHPSGSKGDSRYRADRLRYLALHGVRRYPGAFGLSEAQARPWRIAYEAALHDHFEQAEPHPTPARSHELVSQHTLWTAWDARFAGTALALPGSVGSEITADDLNRRQVIRSLLSQVFRLSDTILDLYYADEASKRDPNALPDRFLDWLESGDPAARQLQRDCEHWIAHTRLIVDTSLDGAGRSWADLARSETWDQLFKLMPVMGVTGKSSRARQAPTRQFRTPSHPRVIICTDTLKEGVDLHLFCDRVVHYGVAWTSGDMEQRVGRVDRYFSQIERRLRHDGPPPEVSLSVGYPHIVASLERQQIERVIDRQRRAEALMSSPLAGARKDETEITLGQTTTVEAATLEPFGPQSFPKEGRSIVAVPQADARAVADHYESWYRTLIQRLGASDWEVSPPSLRPARAVTVHRGATQHEVQWAYDGTLGRYTMTITPTPWPAAEGFSGGILRRVVDRVTRSDCFVRLLVPRPGEDAGLGSVDRFCSALERHVPEIDGDAATDWGEALRAIASDSVEWMSPHKARLRVARGDRGHEVSVYAYEGGVRIIGVVAKLPELDARPEWGGTATADAVTQWCRITNNDLALGYLDLHERDGLVFGVHILHGALSTNARSELVREVAWRADLWEAALTGEDRY